MRPTNRSNESLLSEAELAAEILTLIADATRPHGEGRPPTRRVTCPQRGSNPRPMD